ncbi:MAG: Flp pilus assembly protein CpaB [Stenotrophobium sp.]
MSSTTLKVITVVLVLLALLLAGVSYHMFRGYAVQAQQADQKAKEQAAATPQVLAVVALKPLPAYKPIDRESVALVPVAVKPTQYFTSLDDVVNHVPLVDIDAGAPVTARYFKEGNVLAKVIPPGYQAVSIEVSDVIAVGDFVRPGDIVDVLLYLQNGGEHVPPQARVLLKDARVLAYEDRIIDRPEGIKDDGKGQPQQQRHQRTAVLAIPDADTTRVMLGVSMGQVRLALHSQAPQTDNGVQTAANGLPLSPEAVAKAAASKVPDQAITIDELGRVRPPPSKRAAVSTVDVYLGSKLEHVRTH